MERLIHRRIACNTRLLRSAGCGGRDTITVERKLRCSLTPKLPSRDLLTVAADSLMHNSKLMVSSGEWCTYVVTLGHAARINKVPGPATSGRTTPLRETQGTPVLVRPINRKPVMNDTFNADADLSPDPNRRTRLRASDSGGHRRRSHPARGVCASVLQMDGHNV